MPGNSRNRRQTRKASDNQNSSQSSPSRRNRVQKTTTTSRASSGSRSRGSGGDSRPSSNAASRQTSRSNLRNATSHDDLQDSTSQEETTNYPGRGVVDDNAQDDSSTAPALPGGSQMTQPGQPAGGFSTPNQDTQFLRVPQPYFFTPTPQNPQAFAALQASLAAQGADQPTVGYGITPGFQAPLAYSVAGLDAPLRGAFQSVDGSKFPSIKSNLKAFYPHVDTKYFDQIWSGNFNAKDLGKLTFTPTLSLVETKPSNELETVSDVVLGFDIYSQIVGHFAAPGKKDELSSIFSFRRMVMFQDFFTSTPESVKAYHELAINTAIRLGQDIPASWSESDATRRLALRFKSDLPRHTRQPTSARDVSKEVCYNWNKTPSSCKNEGCARRHICQQCQGDHHLSRCPNKANATASGSNATPLHQRTSRP